MKNHQMLIISLSIIILCLFVTPVCADEWTVTAFPTITPLPSVPQPTIILYEPWNDPAFDFMDGDQFDIVAFLKGSVSPYTDYLGSFFYLILYLIFVMLVYFRTNIQFLTISVLVTFGVWYVWLPENSWLFFLLIVAIGTSAIVFKLVKGR
jgi:hypothetical protein